MKRLFSFLLLSFLITGAVNPSQSFALVNPDEGTETVFESNAHSATTGEEFTLTLSTTDLNSNTEDYEDSLDWNTDELSFHDDPVITRTLTFEVTSAPLTETGFYTATYRVNDADLTSVESSFEIEVADSTTELSSADFVIQSGETVTLSLTTSELEGDVANMNAFTSWGYDEGFTLEPANVTEVQADFLLTHTYFLAGTYGMDFTATDDEGTSFTYESTFTVEDEVEEGPEEEPEEEEESVMANSADVFLECEHDFTDIDVEWADKSICLLAEDEIIQGREEGIYAPNEEVTRAEFLKILLGVMEVEVETLSLYSIASYSDVSEDEWSYHYIMAASALGLVEGYADNTFGPNEAINRAEAMVIWARAAGFNDTYSTGASDDFSDMTSDLWFSYAVDASVDSKIIEGYEEDNTFRGGENISRAEAAVVARRAWYVGF
jgi:hypothetical protein